MNKRNLIIGIIVLIALVGGVALYVASQSHKTAEVKQNNAEETEESVKEVKKETQGQEIQKRKTVTEQKKQEQENSVATIERLIDSLPKTTLKELGFKKLDMSSWKTYRNEKLGFEVKYPRDWTYMEGHMALKPSGQSKEIVDITFSAPGDVPGGGTWGVNFLGNNIALIEQEINKIGSQFEDRTEKRYAITFQHKNCLLVRITNSQNNWISQYIYCPHREKIFVIYLDKRGYFQGFKFLK